MISKELLSEILNIENERISRTVDKFCFPNTNTIAVQYYMTDGWQHINIYELAFMCKSWALDKNQSLTSWAFKTDSAFCEIGSREDSDYNFFEADTEIEAIFKACEWILKDKR